VNTNKQASQVAAIVLAAGLSRRMGLPKQLMPLGDKTLLEHALANLRSSAVDEIVLVLGAHADEIEQKVSTEGLKVVINTLYEQGMGTSLRAGLAAVDPSMCAAMVVLADQPFVRPSTLNQLIAYQRQHDSQITLPLYKGFRGNPVLLDRSVFQELNSLAGDVGCRAIFGGHAEDIHKVPVNDIGVLLDIDTLDDLRHLGLLVGTDEGDESQVHAADLESRPQLEPNHPELVIVGRDEVAQMLGHLARILGFCTTFVDPLLSLNDFPEADRVLHVLDFSRLPAGQRFVVVASRGLCDEEAVEQALATNAAYVGLLANRKRAAEVLNALRQRGIEEQKLVQVRAPAGLKINAETAEEIALSILAEVVAARHAATSSDNSG
jgi:molybdenum cofactor cytidylyltransferase